MCFPVLACSLQWSIPYLVRGHTVPESLVRSPEPYLITLVTFAYWRCKRTVPACSFWASFASWRL